MAEALVKIEPEVFTPSWFAGAILGLKVRLNCHFLWFICWTINNLLNVQGSYSRATQTRRRWTACSTSSSTTTGTIWARSSCLIKTNIPQKHHQIAGLYQPKYDHDDLSQQTNKYSSIASPLHHYYQHHYHHYQYYWHDNVAGLGWVAGPCHSGRLWSAQLRDGRQVCTCALFLLLILVLVSTCTCTCQVCTWIFST